MKSAKYAAFALLASLVLLASCSLGLVGTTSGAATGKVTISIPAVSPGMSAMVEKYQRTVLGLTDIAKTVSSRAFVAASRVDLNWYKDGTWDHSTTVYPNTAVSNPGAETMVAVESLAAGTWTLSALVYNNYNGNYTVFAPGTDLTIVAGQDTPLTLTCLPYSYVSLNGYSSSSPYYFSQPYAWVMSPTGGVQSFGNESWFSFQATSSSYYTRLTVAGQASDAQPFLIFYDANGNYLGQAQPDATGTAIFDAPTSPGATYYCAVANFGNPSTAMGIWFADGAAPVISSSIEALGVWNDLVFTADDALVGGVYKTFQAQANVPYLVGWNDAFYFGGDGTKSLDIAVTASHENGSTLYDQSNTAIVFWDSAFDFDGSYYGQKAPALSVRPTMDEVLQFYIQPYSVGGTGTYAFKIVPKAIHNSLFLLPGLSDAGIVYYSATDVSSYLNVPVTGDFLPGWKFELDGYAAAANGGAAINMNAPGVVELVGGVSYQSSSGWAMGMRQDGIQYTTISTSCLNLSFQIGAFNAGGFWSPYYEAPLKIWIEFGGAWHLLTGFTTLYNSWDYSKGNLVPNTRYDVSVPVSNVSTVDGYWLYPGTVIQGLKLEANGWYWDTVIFSAALADDATVAVNLSVH